MNVATSIPPAERAVASESLPVFAAADRQGVPPVPTGAPAIAPARRTVRSIAKVLEPLERWARDSRRLVGTSRTPVRILGEEYSLPRYLYVGRKGGGDLQRIGIFATLHGDEPEGVLALGKFLQTLEDHPEIAEGYAVFIYPLCNPTGYEDGTRHNRAGVDLNREFWKQSPHPEVRFWCLQGANNIPTKQTKKAMENKGTFISTRLLQCGFCILSVSAVNKKKVVTRTDL